MTLNKVLLPDQLGPIIPVIEPSSIETEQLFKAFKPPKFLLKFFTSNILLLILIKLQLNLGTLKQKFNICNSKIINLEVYKYNIAYK